MALDERLALYRELESLRKRPLLVYVTNERIGIPSQIAADVVPEIMDQLEGLPKEAKSLDLLVVSNGGDPTVAFRIMTLIRERVEKVSVIIPQAAYSAATLFALGSDEIIMHANGNLGPVDPQIHVDSEKGATRFASEDVTAFIRFVKEDVGLTDQQHLSALLQSLCGQVGSMAIGVSARATELSTSLGSKLLKLHMKSDAESQRVFAISEALCTGFHDHGYAVGRKEAKSLGLNIQRDEVIENLAWKIWSDFEKELNARQRFSPLSILMNGPQGSALSSPVPQVNIPPGCPPELAESAYAAALDTIQINPVDVEVILALVESPRLASRCVDKLRIIGARDAEMNVEYNAIVMSSGWNPMTISQLTQEGR